MHDEMFIQYIKFLIETNKENEHELREKSHKAMDDYILGLKLASKRS